MKIIKAQRTKEKSFIKRIRLIAYINGLNFVFSVVQIIPLNIILSKVCFGNLKFSLLVLFMILLVFINIYYRFYNKNKLKKYNRKKILNKNPYIAVCIPALNMENFIEYNLLSILNQSFQDFEIIIVNDASTDENENIIENIQLNDDRIKLITHERTLGVYSSRIQSILNSRSKYIILMDLDNLYLNEHLFHYLYNYNQEYNLDIIEFPVYRQIEGTEKIFFPDNNFESHYHDLNKKIIYQPELSSILYYIPRKKENSRTICGNIWNKMIRKRIFIHTRNYIGKEYYYNTNIITADDITMNIVSYQFANNYSNINLHGYLYIKKKNYISKSGNKRLKKIRPMNYILYFKFLYKYIKDYNKDRNILYYALKDIEHFIIKIKEYNMTRYIRIQLNLIKKILKENQLSIQFEHYLHNISNYLKV